MELAVAIGVLDDLGGLGGFVVDGGDVFEEHGLAAGTGDDDAADFGGGVDVAAGFDDDFATVFDDAAGGEELIGTGEGALDLQGGDAAGGEFSGVRGDAEFTTAAAEELYFGDVGGLDDGVLELGGDAAERGVVIVGGMEGEGEDRNVVDGPGLDDGGRDAGGNAVDVGLEFLIEIDDGALVILADFEADDEQSAAGLRGGVDVLDAGNFPEQLFHGAGDALFDFGGRGAGHADEDVDHRDDDLGLFFSGQVEDRESAGGEGGDDEERR